MTRELTGRHVLAIAVAAFAVIIAANMAMLFSAVGTFPGLVVQNAYVASQGWNARTAAQRDLGWQVGIAYTDGLIEVDVRDTAGERVRGLSLTAEIGRPTTDTSDLVRVLTSGPEGYRAAADLAPGRWRVRITSPAPRYEQSGEIFVPEAR